MTSQEILKILKGYNVGDDITRETKEHWRKMGYGSIAKGIERSTYIGDPFGDGVPRCVTVWKKR